MPRLLVVIPDRLSDIIAKGELQPDYYNPGRVFDDVHILMCNDDRPDPEALKYLVGGAALTLHNYPDDLNLVGRRPEWMTEWRLRRWARGGVDIARRIRPDLMRCHGADWNTYLASRIRAELGIPYVVSLHINADVNPVRRYLKPQLSAAEARHNRFYEHLEATGLRNADLVMPVYRPILPYLKRLGVARVEVCYNVLNGLHLKKKADYRLHQPARIVYVGRLLEEKNPENIMRALVRLPDAELTIVGDGPIRPRLEQQAIDLGISDRVIFRPAVANDELCELLAEQDIFAVHTEYWEISKSVLEALLTGLPLVINKRIGEPVPELEGDFAVKVDNTEEEYFAALHHLLHDDAARGELGQRALAHARANWAPEVTEAKYAAIYRSFLGRRP
ncbi:glycosyltransferase [Sulfurisoma sediminicola]|uniref:Glycosyltransferase involved in cell wall biosynthesis n=1 Tax=Sulfurisoma sediminicola TaxID=1381557 RepID=A0A497XJB0_9PROT|nr:glycosyltransferase [Sulfurisoma sediminicola]RLJ68001.1 glycosyltransferase involved in cell wall biosynthesis [Sulfurisoma sediminicola]